MSRFRSEEEKIKELLWGWFEREMEILENSQSDNQD
jgi:hypothetical protein